MHKLLTVNGTGMEEIAGYVSLNLNQTEKRFQYVHFPHYLHYHPQQANLHGEINHLTNLI